MSSEFNSVGKSKFGASCRSNRMGEGARLNLWVMEPGESSLIFNKSLHDCIAGLEYDDSGNLYVVSWNDEDDNFFLTKYNSVGTRQAQIELPGIYHCRVRFADDGYLYIPGYLAAGNICLWRYDTDLTLQESYSLGFYFVGRQATADISGNIYLTGYGAYPSQIVAYKLDSGFNVLSTWDQFAAGYKGIEIYYTASNIYLSVTRPSGGYQMETHKLTHAMGVFNWSVPPGDQVWSKDSNFTYSMTMSDDENMYIWYEQDTKFYKFDSDGNQLWSKTWLDIGVSPFGSPFASNYPMGSVETDANERMYLVGTSHYSADHQVVSFDTDGNNPWYWQSGNYNGLADVACYGDVIATGGSESRDWSQSAVSVGW